MSRADDRVATHARAAQFAASLGPGWRAIGLFDSNGLPCYCVLGTFSGIPYTSVAHQRITPLGARAGHVWLVVCAGCERRYYMYSGDSQEDDRLGGCLVPCTTATPLRRCA